MQSIIDFAGKSAASVAGSFATLNAIPTDSLPQGKEFWISVVTAVIVQSVIKISEFFSSRKRRRREAEERLKS